MNGKKSTKDIKIIAEIASAHNGSLKKLDKLSKVAISSRADYLKYQIFDNKFLCHRSSKYYKGLNKIEISKKNWTKIINKYRGKIKLILEPFDEDSYKFCKKFKNSVDIKISSSEQDNLPLIRDAEKSFKKIFFNISGYRNNETIKILNKFIKSKKKFVFMYGFQDFPTNIYNIRFNLLKNLKNFSFTTGYADHSDTNNNFLTYYSSVIAINNGVKFIEKHITLKRKQKLPDYISSFEKKEFKNYITYIKNFNRISLNNTYSLKEKKYRDEMGKHAVLKYSKKKNQKLFLNDLIFLRTNYKGFKRFNFYKKGKFKKIKFLKNCDSNSILKKTDIRILNN
tara:strand:+ start:614 stop:1630 length:1017 start_codon:yes stop_codon:yes gene_type:complete